MCVAGAAQAHIVVGTETLRSLVAGSERVLHARILSSGDRVGISTEGGTLSRPYVEAQVIATLKGAELGERVRFAQHGHGVAPFEPGAETLLFLRPIEQSRELGAVAESGVLDWVSFQEHDEAYGVDDANRTLLLATVADYVASARADPAERQRLLRRATLALLTSGDARLAASALRDLVSAPELPLVTKDDLPLLLPVVDQPGASMGVRVALLTELGRRGLVDADAHWPGLLAEQAPPADRVTAIRAAGLSAGAAVQPSLIALLGSDDARVAAAAATALGRPGDAAAVGPLAGALARPEPKVRMAAVRGLGRIGLPAARQALEEAAASHADPETRRRARAELTRRAGS
ncbi:MAG: HEAT repeat domain-containing protein [Myxococcota bacterium]